MTNAIAKLTEEDLEVIYGALNEAIWEIRRINEARGETVFNPAATQALRQARELLTAS
jgi:hypothetical protein